MFFRANNFLTTKLVSKRFCECRNALLLFAKRSIAARGCSSWCFYECRDALLLFTKQSNTCSRIGIYGSFHSVQTIKTVRIHSAHGSDVSNGTWERSFTNVQRIHISGVWNEWLPFLPARAKNKGIIQPKNMLHFSGLPLEIHIWGWKNRLRRPNSPDAPVVTTEFLGVSDRAKTRGELIQKFSNLAKFVDFWRFQAIFFRSDENKGEF